MPGPRPIQNGYLVNCRVNGKRIQRKFTFHNSPDPLRDATDFYNRIKSGATETPDYQTTIERAIADYLKWGQQGGEKSIAWIEKERAILKIFNRWCVAVGVRNPHALALQHLRLFQSYFYENAPFYPSGRTNRPKTTNPRSSWRKYRGVLSSFFNWCVRSGLMRTNLVEGKEFRTKAVEKETRVFEDDEIKVIFQALENVDAVRQSPIPVSTMFRLLLYSGLRIDEAVRLKWANVNFRTKTLSVLGKGNKTRTIPIAPALLPYLKDLPTHKLKYLFDNGKGEPLYHNNYYYKLLVSILNSHGLRHGRIHDFRHTFAVRLLRANVDLKTVSSLLGHSQLKTTFRYLDHTNKTLEAAAVAKIAFPV